MPPIPLSNPNQGTRKLRVGISTGTLTPSRHPKRQREIRIRMALGADRRNGLSLALRQGSPALLPARRVTNVDHIVALREE